MCRRITCPTCSKPSWVGCGLHVESNDVLGLVPLLERCQCKKEYSTIDSVFQSGKLHNVMRVSKGGGKKNISSKKKSGDDENNNGKNDNDNSSSSGENADSESNTDGDGESTTSGETGTTLSSAPTAATTATGENGEKIMVKKKPKRSSSRTDKFRKVKYKFLKFKTMDLSQTRLDHSQSEIKYKEHLKRMGYGSSHKIKKIILRQFTLIAFGLVVAFALKEIENNEREEEEELSATDVVYFVGTVMTTIGYGNITPITDGGKLLVTFTCLPLIAKFAYSLSALTEPILEVARLFSSYALKVLKMKEPLDLEVDVQQMMKTLAIQTTANYGTIDLSVNIPVKDLSTVLNVLGSGWEKVSTKDVNHYIDDLAGDGFAESFGTSISVSEIVTLLNLIKANHAVRKEKLNMLASFFISSAVFLLGFAYFTSVNRNGGWSRIDSLYFSTISLSTVGFGDFVPESTRQIIFWYVWVTLGCGIFATLIGSFTNILGARQDEHSAKKQLTKTFRKKDVVRRARMSLDDGSVRGEKKKRFTKFTEMISGL